MICILGNENRTYSEIYNPICVTCVVCIFMSPKNIYPFLSIDHLPNSQDANPVVINLNSLRYPLETRQALSFVGVSWFLVSYHWNCFYLLIVCPIKCFKVDFPPPGPPKKTEGNGTLVFQVHVNFYHVYRDRTQTSLMTGEKTSMKCSPLGWGKTVPGFDIRAENYKCLTWWRFLNSKCLTSRGFLFVEDLFLRWF